MSAIKKDSSAPDAWAAARAFLAPFDRSEAALLAVSGGVDSMVLWHWLREAGFQRLLVVHVDHGLRGEESRGDADFVAQTAEGLSWPYEIRRVDVLGKQETEKLSLETAARECRYAAFAEVAREQGCRRVFLAHHADDRIETVLMNFFRGAGSRGLVGMTGESTRSVEGIELSLTRPLLSVSRRAILEYAREHGLSWREDASNVDDFSLRNRLRNHLLPEAEAVFGREVRRAILRTADLAALDEAWVAGELGELPRAREGQGLEVATLRSYPAARRNRLLLTWLAESGVPDCGLAEVERCTAVLRSEGQPAKASLPGGYHVRRRAGVLFIESPSRE